MKLQLCVKNHLVAEKELDPISFGRMRFKHRCEIETVYINSVIEQIKYNYKKYLETRNWEIYLIVESKIHLINEQQGANTSDFKE